MPTHPAPRLPKWPFIVGDAILLAVAWFIVSLSDSPSPAAIIGAVACAGLGSLLAAFPFVVEYARRQEEALDERQRSLEGLSRLISDSAEQISIAANGIQALAGAFQKHLRVTADLTEKLASLSVARPRKADPAPQPLPATPEPPPAPSVPESPSPSQEPKVSGDPVPKFALKNSPPVSKPAPEPESAPAPRRRPPKKSRTGEAAEKKVSSAASSDGSETNGDSPDRTAEPPAIQPASDGGTRLNVTAYIGIGNRLFIRGEGSGLSWDRGVPLQFVSIGRWRWEAANPEGPVRFKLYKNDEQECAALGTQTLSPGTEQEIKAAFQ